MLLPFRRSPLLVQVENAWGLPLPDALERDLLEIFERYFRKLQSGDPRGKDVPWDEAAAQLEGDWDALIRKVLEAAADAKANPNFTLTNPYTVEWIADHWTNLVTEMTAPTKETLHRLIAQGVKDKDTVQQVARDMRPLIGLRQDQTDAVQRHFQWLQQPHRLKQPSGEWKELRALDQDAAAKRAMKYAEQLLRQRAELIARTEIMTASNQGLLHSWMDAKDKGLILPQARRKWKANLVNRTCDRCKAFAGTTATLTGNFVSRNGEVAKAPPLHPACRCSQSLVTGINLKETT